MIVRSLLSLILVYLALVAEICCSRRIPTDWGRPQFLLLVLFLIALRNRSGISVVSGACIGFLVDSLEPTGMGRFFLLYSLVAWWLQRRRVSGKVLHSSTQIFLLCFLAFTIPVAGAFLGVLLASQPLEVQGILFESLASTGWTMLLAIPLLLILPRPVQHRDSGSHPSRTTYRWNMLTNS